MSAVAALNIGVGPCWGGGEFVNVGNKRVGYHTADGERHASAKHANPLTMLAKDLSSSMNTSAHDTDEDRVRPTVLERLM